MGGVIMEYKTFGELKVGDTVYHLISGHVYKRTITSIDPMGDKMIIINTDDVFYRIDVLKEQVEWMGWLASSELMVANIKSYSECLEKMKVGA